MVKFILSVLPAVILMLGPVRVDAQRLVGGEKVPEVRFGEWLTPAAAADGPMYLEFFHPASTASVKRVAVLEAMAVKYGGKMGVVLLVRDDADKARGILAGKGYHFHAAMDDKGKTYTAFDVQYVPFGVLVNGKGRVVWFGNPASLTDAEIGRAL